MSARILSVAGGKGGVGKSIVAANLAVAVAQTGRRVVLVDADLGAANQHTLLGVDRPGPTLHGIFTHEIERLDEAVVPTPIPGVRLVPGSGAVAGAANIAHTQKQKLLRQIRALDADVVVVDVGAGMSFNVLDLFLVGEQRLLVITPHLTSLSNAYACLKGAVLRALPVRDVGPSPETERVAQIVARVRTTDEAAAGAIEAQLARLRVWLVGNQVSDPRQAGAFFAMTRMIRDFLGVRAEVAGFLSASPQVEASVNRRRPFVLDAPEGENARILDGIARRLLAEPVLPDEELPGEVAAALTDEERLPTDLGRYARRAERHAVDWTARLERAGGAVAVRVRDVSLGGALVETACDLAVGERATLVFEDLDGRPAPTVIVRHVVTQKRAGLEFIEAGEVAARLVAAAAG